MLNKPDERVLRAMANLAGNPNWSVILAWQKAELQRLYKVGSCIELDTQLRRNQGACQALEDQIQFEESALEVIRGK